MGSINISRAQGGPDLTINNPSDTVYLQGNAETDESWRLRVESDNSIYVEKREPLTEAAITLDEAKVTAIQNAGYSETSLYVASVTTDSRADQNSPDGIVGDMAGRVIVFNGVTWTNYDDQFVLKAIIPNDVTADFDRILIDDDTGNVVSDNFGNLVLKDI